jgi:PadR family transcriptional regulator
MIPLEVAILEASDEFRRVGKPEAHGYLLATMVQGLRHTRRLTAYGTLYKALTRLEQKGYLASRWEDPQLAAAESRPRRRFYRLTGEGEAALSEARAADGNLSTYRAAATAVQ